MIQEGRNSSQTESFNYSYDKNFYKNYKSSGVDNEWKNAIDEINKLKIRFSTNSRLFLSALVECIIKQIALNGIISCVSDKKRIIQLSHIFDTTKPGFNERFPLYGLISNLNTFKEGQKIINDQNNTIDKTTDTEMSSGEDGDNSSDDTKTQVKTPKETDLFTLPGISLDDQYKFRYYIAESCREIRMDLSSDETSKDENKELYKFSSVSKLFKNFCSTLICEFLIRIGYMIEKEIETRGIKTVNDNVIGTVISQYHIVCGIDYKPTFEFIDNVTSKYSKFIDQKKTSKTEAKTS